jgi:hypothetical protein
MYSHSDIEDAVEGGALTADQAASLRNFVASRTGTPTADEEHVRWLLGFHDFYIYFSSILLMCGVGWLGSKIEVGRGPSFFIPLLVAGLCWGLAEYFVKRKRLALTGISLTWVFVYAVYFTVMLLAAQVIGPSESRATGQFVSAVSAALAAGAAFLHWKRFGEPVAFSLILGSIAIAIMSLLGAAVPNDPDGTVSFLVMTLLGVATLVYAQTWEAKDIHRITKKADIAFWLHWVAAFEVAIGLMGLLGLMSAPSQGAAVGGIVVFIVMALVGIILDRRLWALFGAWPGAIGIYTLIHGATPRYNPYSGYEDYGSSPYSYSPYGGMGNSVDDVMLTLLIVGAVLIAIGVVWTPLRRTLGALAGPLAGKIPPTSPADNKGQAFE